MKLCYRSIILILFLITSTHSIFTQSLQSLHPSKRGKIDPLLHNAMKLKEKSPHRKNRSIEMYSAGKRLAKAKGDVVAVLIQSSDDIRKYIKSIGGTVGSKHGDIYTALIPINSIADIAERATVQYIEASRPMYSSLDLSRAKTGADVLQSLPDLTKRLTGKGVIIGFTDSGINTEHPNFKLLDGRTRILYVWDQYAESGGSPPAGYSYGIEKDSAAINAKTWYMADVDQHGTHVAGIAAGNGNPSGQYIGMAPEADIIMVSNRGDDLWNHGLTTVGTLDGYDYIRQKAQALGKRFVINTSQGTNLGPHDGTTLFEKAINADVAAGSINCISAGNEGANMKHASAVVTTSSPEIISCSYLGLPYTTPDFPFHMDIWYSKNDRMVLQISQSDHAGIYLTIPPVDTTFVYAFGLYDTMYVTSTIGSSLNEDNEIFLSLCGAEDLLKLQFTAAPGNNLPDGGRVDLWWERNIGAFFFDHVDPTMTLGMPACADSAITVASYNNRNASFGSANDISAFSGRGPRRDGVLKPDISGIGGMVASSVLSNDYATFSGTSMSSPHAAGAVALLLQQNPSLTYYQVKQKLITSATADGFTGAVPNTAWGHGKLNVYKAAGFPDAPFISVADTVRCNNPFYGFTTYDTITIKNIGVLDLTISNVTVSNPMFSVDKTSLVIPPRSQDKLVVGVTPISLGDFTGSLTLTSNDTSRPTSTVVLVGHSDYAPHMIVLPDSLSVTLSRGDSITQSLIITNTGSGNLQWNIALQTPTKLPENLIQAVEEMRQTAVRPTISSIQPLVKSSTSSSTQESWTPEKAINTKVSLESFFNAPDVAIIHADYIERVVDVQNKLIFTGKFNSVSLIDGRSITPTLQQLQSFKAVLVYSNFGWLDATAMGDVLAAYLENGGGVACALFSVAGPPDYYGLEGNFVKYRLIEFGGFFLTIGSLGHIYLPTHPLMEGVARFETGSYGFRPLNSTIVLGAMKVADWNDGKPLIVYKDQVGPSIARRVDLGFYPPSDDVVPASWMSSGDGAKILSNALLYVGGRNDFLTITPDSGVIAPGAVQTVDVKFNSKDLLGGDYRQIISLNGNDPVSSQKNIPANMHVNGMPVISIVPDSINSGTVYIGGDKKNLISVRNIGSEGLSVTSITSSLPVFTVNHISFNLEPYEEKVIELTFIPTDNAVYNGTLIITSNDLSHPSFNISLQGQGKYAPVISVLPDSLNVEILPGQSATRTITISNSGANDLMFDALLMGYDKLSRSYTLSANAVSSTGVIPAGAEYKPDRVIVKFKDGASPYQRKSIVSKLHATTIKKFSRINVEVWDISGMSVKDAVELYKDNQNIEYIEPDYLVQKCDKLPNDPMFSQLWGVQKISAPVAWDSTTGTDIIIGNLDTGIDPNHSDLIANLWTNPGEIPGNSIDDDGNGYIDDIHGWNFAYNSNNLSDDVSHGTHTAGTIAAVGNNGVGVVGVCWSAKIMTLKFMDYYGGYVDDAIEALEYAVNMHAKLTNNSWGGSSYSQALYDAIKAAGDAGCLFVAAAGNNSKNTDISSHYPSAYNLENIISVAATTSADGLSSFSNYGPVSVDLGAPGSDIYSTIPGSGFASKNGTSMAAPHVSGAAALMLSANPILNYSDLKALIISSADSISALSGKTVSGGRLNVARALSKAKPWLTVYPSSGTVSPGSSIDLTVTFYIRDTNVVFYNTSLDINSDDPLHPVENIPIHMHIKGTPAIGVSPDTLNMGTIGVGYSRADTIKIKNIGTDLLNIAHITSTNPVFTIMDTSFSLMPGRFVTLPVRFTPTDSVAYTNNILIESSDVNCSTAAIVLQGKGVYYPVIEINPDSLAFHLIDSSYSSTAQLTIINAGNSTLNWNINQPGSEWDDTLACLFGKRVGIYITTATHTIIKSDLESRGARVYTLPRPFSLSDLDTIDIVIVSNSSAQMSSIEVSLIRTWVQEGHSLYIESSYEADTTKNNELLAGTGIKHHKLPLPSPDTELFDIASHEITEGIDRLPNYNYTTMCEASGSAFVIARRDVDHYPNVAVSTLGAGRVFLGCGSLGADSHLNQWIRINNSIYTRIFVNRALDWLARRRHFTKFANIEPLSGFVQPLSSQVLNIEVNSLNGVIGGFYEVGVEVNNNDPFRNPFITFFTIQVHGKPVVYVSTDEISAGVVFIGKSWNDTIKIINAGNDILNVANITSSLPTFTVNRTSFSLSPGQMQSVVVKFTPADSLLYSGDLTIVSDDSLHPTINIALHGQGVYPPRITMSPDSIVAVVESGDSLMTTLTIRNTGGYVLNWKINLPASFVSMTQDSGAIAPGIAQDVILKLNAKNKIAGVYQQSFTIVSNDTTPSPKTVHVKMRVTGKPVMTVTPDTLNYDPAYEKIVSRDTLWIKNVGTDTLKVSSIIISDTTMHLDKTSFFILPGSQKNVQVSITPSDTGMIVATITITCNDSISLTKAVPVICRVTYPVASMTFNQGWKLVSVPLAQVNDSAAIIFPGKYGSMFGYDQLLGDYIEAEILKLGLGYWIYYLNSDTVTITGPLADTMKVTCKAGWHLIGSREREVQVANLQLSAGSIYGSAFYYDTSIGDYAETSVIEPGRGIWIYVTEDCELTIP